MNKNTTLIVAGLGVLLFLIGGYFLFVNKKSEEVTVEPSFEEEVVPTIAPEDLGLEFTARSDNKAVKFVIKNIDEIESVDYEVTYLATGDIPRGVIGHLEVTPGASKLESKYIDLGSCSSGRCKYDEGVKSVNLVLKIIKKGGMEYSSVATLQLEEE